MSLSILPNEILEIIFGYCDANDLIRLYDVCERFRSFFKNLFITIEMSEKFRQRCHSLLSYKSKFSTSNNWKHGIYTKRTLTKWDDPHLCCYNNFKKFHPHLCSYNNFKKFQRVLQMTKDTILLSDKKTGKFLAFNRTKYGTVFADNWVEMCFSRVRDIFPCNDVIITNHFGGCIRQWTIESLNGRMHFNTKILKNPISADTNIRDGIITGMDYVMDVTPQHIILGSSNGEIKIWKYIREKNAITEENVISPPKFAPELCSDQLKLLGELNSIAIDPTGTKVIAGFIHDSCNSVSCTIYDINKCYTETNYNFDTEFSINYNKYYNRLLWENPNTFLISEMYEIKKVDVRTHKVVHTWKSPVNHSFWHKKSKWRLSCISTDNQYAFMTGTFEGRVILWDQRKSTPVQEYEILLYDDCRKVINCLQFDNSKLYMVADQLYELDFYNSAQASCQ